MNESRKDKSLYTLTKKFVEMLKKDELVDLNIVTNELNCAKKRRIYDVSNVLEGIGLIKKTQKNLYQYTGKTYKDETNTEHGKLQKLTDEKESLERLEKELDKDISNMRMNYEALATQDSYIYLTRKDFIDAFGKDSSILVINDSRNASLIFEEDIPNTIHVSGYVVKPITIKLVNTENSDKPLPKVELDENVKIESTSDEDDNNKNDIKNDPSVFDNSKKIKKSDGIILFRRNFKPKTFIECDSRENEKLSKNVLDYDRYEGKSKFFYVHKNQLVLDSDYKEPDFINIELSTDIDYEENFSSNSPSIHDLFDFKIELSSPQEMQVDQNEEMIEEEYIIEELDENSYELLQ